MTKYQVRDAGGLAYFTAIPNIIDDYDLSVHAVRLYLHLKRVAGESGVSWQSTETLAKACNMAAGTVSKAKNELQNHTPPLIEIEEEKNPKGGKKLHRITITDIWEHNRKKYRASSPDEFASSPDEFASSPGEIKKNPIKKITLRKTHLTDSSPDKTGDKPPPKPKSEYVLFSEKMEETFSKARGCVLPDWDKNPKAANKRWRVPLNRILGNVEGNLDDALLVIEKTVEKMVREGLTFDAPDQILKTASSLIIDWKAGNLPLGQTQRSRLDENLASLERVRNKIYRRLEE